MRENNKIAWMKTFEKQFNIKTKLETLDHYVRSILNKFDPDDEIEVDIQEFDGKKIVNVKILDRILNWGSIVRTSYENIFESFSEDLC